MKLLAFVFLLVFLLPRQAMADFAPSGRWNPRSRTFDYDPHMDKTLPGYDPRKDPTSEQFVPELVGLRDPRYDEEEKEKKEGKAALMALVALLGVAALSREGRANAEITVSQHEL